MLLELRHWEMVLVFEKIIEDFSDLGYTMAAPTVNAKRLWCAAR